ncbi:MAG: hypothetical protein HYY49_01565, partial [Ignavibacteriales bacterium]|nr:hypothetical protein [Ignavibacteriales bacterium]
MKIINSTLIMRLTKILSLAFLLAAEALSQELVQGFRLSGNLRSDVIWSTAHLQDSLQQINVASEKRSPLTAALYSAVIPGAGQVYNESYLEGIGFVGAEIGLWVVYAIYDLRGDRQTNDFQNFADIHWSVVQYAEWLKTHFSAEASG